MNCSSQFHSAYFLSQYQFVCFPQKREKLIRFLGDDSLARVFAYKEANPLHPPHLPSPTLDKTLPLTHFTKALFLPLPLAQPDSICLQFREASPDNMTSANPMEALSKSKVDCLQTYLQKDGTPYDKLVIGAIILKSTPDGTSNILMLKRAAHEEFYPNNFEIPGGKVEDTDTTILAAVKREVYEETNMVVTDIIGSVQSFDYTMEKKIVEDGKEHFVSYTSLQLNYICEVASYDLTVNPEEHSEGRFVALSELEHLDVSEQMRSVVEAGFG